MFSGGFTEIGFILFIAFLVFGPKKLPEIARVLGKGMGELRRASDELKNSLEQEIRNLDRPDDEVSNPEQETHSYTYAKTEEETYEHPDEEFYERPDEETYEHADAESYQHTDAESYEHADAEGYQHTDAEGYEHADAEGYQRTDAESYEHADTESYEYPAVEAHELSEQSEGDLEPAPEYGYDYSEPTQHEPEPRG